VRRQLPAIEHDIGQLFGRLPRVLRSLTELMLMMVPALRADMSPITTLVPFSTRLRLTSISWALLAGSTSLKVRASRGRHC
jgi:hypothetical protein